MRSVFYIYIHRLTNPDYYFMVRWRCLSFLFSLYVCKSVNSTIYLFIGYYCSGGAMSSMPSDGVTGNICPVGHYCPMGASSPVVCPDGTYSNTTGIGSSFYGTAWQIRYQDASLSCFFFWMKVQRRVMTAPLGLTVCQVMVSVPVQQDITVLAVVLKVSYPALLAHTALSLALAKWSSALFVQQVRVLSYRCLHCSAVHCKVFH